MDDMIWRVMAFSSVRSRFNHDVTSLARTLGPSCIELEGCRWGVEVGNRDRAERWLAAEVGWRVGPDLLQTSRYETMLGDKS